MWPFILLLLSFCGGKFYLIKTIYIGIDVINNLKIFHILKPSNLAFTSINRGNSKDKLNIGILTLETLLL